MTKSAKQHESVALGAAERLLSIEIEGLQALYGVLDGTFEKVCNRLLGLKGRVVISGMGKSGHIARKIAATLASTGTPSMFVHPGEASHGDLGMITEQDAVILLSNSGETAELSDIIHFTRRHSILLIAIVRRKSSMLVEAADYAFVLPEIPEASPVGAPTTSTIMMLALGDAIAAALLEMRGFSAEDFNKYHPGGKLGKRFIKISDLMRKGIDLPLVNETTSMADIILEITGKSLGCAGVIGKDGRLSGIITDGDLRRHMGDELMKLNAATIMTKNPITVTKDMLAVQALDIMNKKAITALFVLEDGKPVGLIHIHDILRAGIA
jgi:arabinose-5-phosphate isomerase